MSRNEGLVVAEARKWKFFGGLLCESHDGHVEAPSLAPKKKLKIHGLLKSSLIRVKMGRCAEWQTRWVRDQWGMFCLWMCECISQTVAGRLAFTFLAGLGAPNISCPSDITLK